MSYESLLATEAAQRGMAGSAHLQLDLQGNIGITEINHQQALRKSINSRRGKSDKHQKHELAYTASIMDQLGCQKVQRGFRVIERALNSEPKPLKIKKDRKPDRHKNRYATKRQPVTSEKTQERKERQILRSEQWRMLKEDINVNNIN